MVNMVTVSRAYEMARKVVEVQDDVVNKTIQSLGNPVS
jgi:flagellar basal body rod protein FlgG